MDPKKLAEEILEQLFPQQEVVNEESEEDEEEEVDEDEGEEEEVESDEGEEETAEPAQSNQSKETKGGTAAKNQASVAMKPSMASAASTGTTSVGGVVDASGKGNQPFPGVAPAQEFQVTNVNAAANQATLNMKPSFAAVEMPGFNKAQVQEDVKTLFGADVSEEFLNKASSLYEASLTTNLQVISEQMANIFEEKLAESTLAVAEELENKVNDYLTYVVEEWVKENQLAVDNGLRTEIAENFIQGLKNLFVESYIEVPENKTDVFEEMSTEIESLETRVNEEIEKNVALAEKVSLLEAVKVFEEETKALKSIDVENLRKLAENVEFSNTEDFRSKVKILVENYTKAKTSSTKATPKKEEAQSVGEVIDTLMEETEANEEQQFISESIKLYSDILGRTVQG